MKADPLLPLYREQHGARAGRDRLELLTALIGGPAFDPLFRGMVIRIPARHPVFRWACLVAGCERPRKGSLDMCSVHHEQRAQAQARGEGMAAFLAAAQPLGPSVWTEQVACRVCPGRPATHARWRLCHRHYMRWYRRQRERQAGFEEWLAGQVPFDGYGPCRVAVCPDLASTPLGLCSGHESRYQTQGRPGGMALPSAWSRNYEARGLPVPVTCRDEEQFRAWCASPAAGAVAGPDHPGRAGAAGGRGDPLGLVRPRPAGTAHPVGYRLGAGPGQYLPRPRHRLADRA